LRARELSEIFSPAFLGASGRPLNKAPDCQDR
jgi:hypothetical protein